MRTTEPPSGDKAAERDELLRRAELIISNVLRGGARVAASLARSR